MRILAYGESIADDRVLLRLVTSGSGVELQVVDESGHRRPGGTLLCITPDGYLGLAGCVEKSFGFPLDAGRLKVLKV